MQSVLNKEWAQSTSDVNKDLQQERSKLNFNQEQMAEIIWSGRDNLHFHRRLQNWFVNDPVAQNTHHYYDMTREEKIEHAYMKTARFVVHSPEKLNYKNIMYINFINMGAVRINQVKSKDCKLSSSCYV